MKATQWILLLCILPFSKLSVAQTISLYKQIAINARYMTVDDLGNVYVVRNDNTLLRYNENGDSTGFYKSVLNGEIRFVDAANPLRVLVYYPEYFKIILLDRMLSQKNEVDLRKMNSASAVASSADGNMWVYDRFNARLKKIDDQLQEIKISNDLRQELQTVPSPTFMTERDWKVYMTDTSKGIFVFDRYGNYITTYPIRGIDYMQIQGSKLIYRKENNLYSWDSDKVKEAIIKIPDEGQKILHAALIRDKLFVLQAAMLNIYTLSDN